MKIVISIGGSVLTKNLNYKNFSKFAKIIEKIAKNNQVFVVIGGGKIARIYQKISKQANASKKDLDIIGIIATHLNAKTFSTLIKNSCYISMKSEKEALKEIKSKINKYKIFVCAGYDVGHSTDYDSAIIAKTFKADLLINFSLFDGIYDKDPAINKNAKIIKRMNYDDLINLVKKLSQEPGEHKLFDLKAAKLIKKAKIKTIFTGKKVKNLIEAIEGKEVGTIVSDCV